MQDCEWQEFLLDQFDKNPISAAPGFQIENVFVLAGVPNIFKSIVKT